MRPPKLIETIRRLGRFCLLLSVFAGITACSAQVKPEPNHASVGQDDALLSELREVKVDLDLRDASLYEAIDELADQAGLPFMIDPELAEAAGLTRPNTVRLRLENAPFISAFEAVFEQAVNQEAAPNWPLPVKTHWRVEGGIAVFGLEPVEVRVYDIRELLTMTNGEPLPPDFIDDPRQLVLKEQTQQVIDLLMTTVGQPAHWDGRFTDTLLGGNIAGLNGNLIIKTTLSNHQQIEMALERLKAS